MGHGQILLVGETILRGIPGHPTLCIKLTSVILAVDLKHLIPNNSKGICPRSKIKYTSEKIGVFHFKLNFEIFTKLVSSDTSNLSLSF